MVGKFLARCLTALLLMAASSAAGEAAIAPYSPAKVTPKAEVTPKAKVDRKTDLAPNTEVERKTEAERKSEALPTREAFRELVAKLLKDPAFVEKYNTFEKGTKMHRLFDSFMRETLSDQAVVDFLYLSMRDNAEHVTDFEAFGKALAGDYAVRGLSRLPEEDLQELLRVMRVLAEKLPARDCAGMLRPGSNFDYHWLELLPEGDAQSYLRLTRKALVAEIGKTPRMAANSPEQTKVATQALIAELRMKLPAEKLTRFGKIWSNPEQAEDAELCWGFQTLITSILDLPGDPRRWMVREYANMLRPPR